MPSKVLLRGFGPEIPENQVVTFCDDLPSKEACAQCDNVSSELQKDPGGHGYCPSCRKMCTSQDVFECLECEEKFHISKLIIDRSVGDRIKTMKVICPNATREKPVQITFNALKAHLAGCACDQINDAPADSDQPSSLSLSSMAMSKCPRCPEVLPKKLVLAHVKACKGPRKLQRAQRQQIPSPEVSKGGPANRNTSGQLARVDNQVSLKGAAGKSSVVDSSYCRVDPPSVTDHPPELPTDLHNLIQQLRQARQEMSDLKCTNAKLSEQLSTKNEILFVMKDQAESRQHMAQEAMADLNKSVASSLSAFKDQCDRLRGDIDQLSSSINQVTQRFQQELEKIAHIMFAHGQEQGGLNLGQP